jgi:hypothetical protein
MPFALGRGDAERCQLGGCVERDRVFGDEQENDRRHGDTKARTMLSRYSNLSEWARPRRRLSLSA